MNNYYRNRQKEFAFMLQEENLAAAIFEDSENNRNSAIRYFTNHPGDAVLIITNSAETILCPWDENIAKKRAIATKIIGLTKYNRNSIKAIKEILSELNIKKDSRIDIPPTTPYPIFLKYVEALFSYNVLCRENGIHQKVDKMRAIKDYE